MDFGSFVSSGSSSPNASDVCVSLFLPSLCLFFFSYDLFVRRICQRWTVHSSLLQCQIDCSCLTKPEFRAWQKRVSWTRNKTLSIIDNDVHESLWIYDYQTWCWCTPSITRWRLGWISSSRRRTSRTALCVYSCRIPKTSLRQPRPVFAKL